MRLFMVEMCVLLPVPHVPRGPPSAPCTRIRRTTLRFIFQVKKT